MKFDHFRPSLKILRLIGELDEFKGSWRSISNISTQRLVALRQVATIESIGSSTRIEGATLTDEQIKALLSGVKMQSFRSRDEEEVMGYADSMDAVFTNWQQIPFSENHIKQLHGILLKHSHKDERHRGYYKTVPNHVEAFDPDGNSLGIIFKTTNPFDTPFRMTGLVDWTVEALNKDEIHPLLIIAVFAVVFLAIHPFQDGNGRLSRALTTLLLLKTGYLYVPYSSLESVIEASKEAYYLALRLTQSTLDNDQPDWQPWIWFFLQTLQKQKVHLQTKLSREHLVAEELPALSARILELVRQHGRLQISQIEQLTKESRSTIKLRLNELIERKNLARHGRGPATWYALGGTMDL